MLVWVHKQYLQDVIILFLSILASVQDLPEIDFNDEEGYEKIMKEREEHEKERQERKKKKKEEKENAKNN